MDRYGDYSVGRTITAGRRVNSGFTAETITASRTLTIHDYQWIRITNASTQDVILPDATTLENGWQVVVDVPAASAASVNVKTYDAVTPVLLRNIESGRAYEFTLVDNSTDEGTWHVNFLEEADAIPTERYIETFDATTDWGTAAAGYYTITITEATHGRGANPNVQIQSLSGTDYITVTPDRILVESDGDTKIRVPETPDLRFAGRAIFV